MTYNRILLVEDDPNLGFVIRENLVAEGFQVMLCDNGLNAVEIFKDGEFDICLLDVMLPGMDGFNLGKKIREQDPDVPILFLTARDNEEDRIGGFQLGADDYITKPFNMKELILRIRVFLKRSTNNNQTAQGLGDLTFDHENLVLVSAEEEVKLTQREADLLNYLIQHMDKVCKREEILKELWGDDDYFLGRSLDVFISRLRKLLKPFPHLEITNYHGVGFRLKVKQV